jgi:uracil-DNA glycosylase
MSPSATNGQVWDHYDKVRLPRWFEARRNLPKKQIELLNLNEILITFGSIAPSTLFDIDKRERNERRPCDTRAILRRLKMPHTVNQQ